MSTVVAADATRLNTTGRVLHWAFRYDLLVWLVSFGHERSFREKLLSFASLKQGESVLDVGCGTGTLAVAAKRQVGAEGNVHGIDASPEMIARARKKARNAGAEVFFKNGIVEALPFPDRQFDVVLATMVLHHLPRKPRQQCASEIRRVLKPGGRLLAVDFAAGTSQRKWLPSHFHGRHGRVAPEDLLALFRDAGFPKIENGNVGIGDLHYVLAQAPILHVATASGSNS
jgi:ubiquinone/menaquinone biosynthesis C-methylase UbiE